MRSSILFTATFVAAVLAAPQRRAIVWNVKTITDTVWVTEGYEPTSTVPAPTIVAAAPPATTSSTKPTTTAPPIVAAAPPKTTLVSTYVPPAPKTVVFTPPVSTTAAPEASPAPVADDGSDASILAVANKYRSLYGLPAFKWSSQLKANAAKTGEDNGGVNMNHELNSGSMGQVITPGLATASPSVDLGGLSPFEAAYLSWMCEKSSDSEISKFCPIMQSAMHMMYSSTGHYDILTSSSYSSIGCKFVANPAASSSSPYQGIWTCDVA